MPGSIPQKNSPINPTTWHPHSCLTSPGLCLPSHLQWVNISSSLKHRNSPVNVQTPSKETEGHIFYPNVVRGLGVSAMAQVPADTQAHLFHAQQFNKLHLGKPITHPKNEWQIQGQASPTLKLLLLQLPSGVHGRR